MTKKRIITAILLAALLLSALSVGAEAFRGSGIEVMARDVKVIKAGLLGKKVTFSDTDFKCAFAIDDFESITVTALPSSTSGTLMLAGRRVREGQTIKRRNIAAMVFVPADKAVAEAEFSFSLDGGEEHICKIKLLSKVNYAPSAAEDEAASLSIATQAGISVWGRMEGSDPEGDELEFIVAAYPKSGSLTLLGSGKYKYTPEDGFTGYDSFTYAVRDEYGNYSKAEEVVLKVTERMSDIVYGDMTDKEEYNAAVAMSAMGIMAGTLIGDEYYFMPTEAVTRAEFTAMALKAAGIKADVGATYFDDDADIPVPLRGYVASAARRGIVDGRHDGTKLVFAPREAITVYEAASIMSAIIGDTAEETLEYSTLEGVPVWARAGVEAMLTLGIIDEDRCDPSAELTRADAAEFLYRMVSNS